MLGKGVIYVEISLIFLFLFILSGCLNRSIEEISWQEEVLIASECGMDGLPCCPDKEQPCQYGQVCCSAPGNSDKNACLDECSFGGLGEFCRAGEEKCDQGLACLRDRCVRCGVEGNPCCTDGLACIAGENTDSSRTECRNGICRICGFFGNSVCDNEPKCNPGHLSSNNVCYRCGGPNQPCCRKDKGAEYDCDPSKALVCELGFCSEKN